MINSLFLDPNYLAAKKMLDATMLRHEAIASNLANIETPHYRRIDVNPSFATELSQAVAAQDTSKLSSLQPSLEADMTAVASRRDGNTVDLEKELMNLNQNTLAHNVETHLITNSLFRLRMAATGRSSG
jgi:flagellar basal-body rod protein FlgB